MCKCVTPWEGDDCTTLSPQHELCPNMCNNRGSCSNGVCKCINEFTGRDCGMLTVCPQNCSSHGSCLNGRCKCYDGFAGDTCAFACPSAGVGIGCAGNGKCAMKDGKATCFCQSGWVGDACDESDVELSEEAAEESKGGSPVAIIIAALAGALVVLMLGGYAYNYGKGARGMAAVPGYSLFKSKTSTAATDDSYSRVE